MFMTNPATDVLPPQSVPQEILLSEYKIHDYHLHTIHLIFDLNSTQTIVTATSQFKRNGTHQNDLVLDGEKMILKSIKIGDVKLTDADYTLTDKTLTLHSHALPQDDFTLEIKTELNPSANTELEGLYLSNGMYCTQCESQGFRRITYYIDRPDNMAEFFVTLIGATDNSTPILLSNGNPIEQGKTDDGRLISKWHDPFKKPCYLFAIVAGDLACVSDDFTTQSGRHVDLKIYVNHGNEKATDYAMDSLKRSMKWDEDVYNLEYDLDLFMIVAVDDFNFGAMENKGLNVFNSKYILAEPTTATDIDYEHIEGVVAHEYFHNWTGNRVTCRDWFQLCLKEGLTVYRDQSFSGDMRSNATKRIDDVIGLRAGQFPEDAGALSHSVRPEKYIEINNFYTATVYEKGAELCRMLHLILGKENFFKGIDLYFERFDGMAVTVEDFIQAMADATRVPLSQFLLWYKQSGTPHIDVTTNYNADTQKFTLNLTQSIKNIQGNQKPFLLDIPILTAFIGLDGAPLNVTYNNATQHEHLLRLQSQTAEFIFENVTQEAVPSLLRQFSAPVILADNYLSDTYKLHLMRYDTDTFNRYDSGQIIAENIINHIYAGKDYDHLIAGYLAALQDTLSDNSLDNAFKAYNAVIPSLNTMLQKNKKTDPAKMLQARTVLRMQIAENLTPIFEDIYRTLNSNDAFKPTADEAGKRQLKNTALGYLIKANKFSDAHLKNLYETVNNMTDKIAILGHLSDNGGDLYLELMADFYTEFTDNPLVIDKWFALQARSTSDTILQNIQALLEHEAFSYTNPNRARSLIGVFLHANPARFHTPEGYAFAHQEILKLDKVNPKTAARMATAFENVSNLADSLVVSARSEFDAMLADKSMISNDLYEIMSKIQKSL
ncbi:MAG: aminopeptidase N [Alphaproteobacteria bacterium]|jgi:aminopeptidase N